jgi:hypothetical protein
LPIESGDHIRTGEDVRVEIVLSENVLWMLEPKSEIVAEHMEVNAGRFDLPLGTLIGKVDSVRAAGFSQHWDFQTPAAVVGVRGTEFAIDSSGREGTSLGVFEGTVAMEPAETAAGPQPPVEIPAGRQADAKRGKPIRISPRFSPHMMVLLAKRPPLRRRQKQIQDTWSPFTPTVRSEMRKQFVAPPPKRRPIHARRRPRPGTQTQQ